jgi:riboflavin synthase
MFTGLVTDIGRVTSVEDANGIRRLRVESRYPESSIQLGASIEHSGVCLTVVEFGPTDAAGSWWTVEAIPETLSRTTLGGWTAISSMAMSMALAASAQSHRMATAAASASRLQSLWRNSSPRKARSLSMASH